MKRIILRAWPKHRNKDQQNKGKSYMSPVSWQNQQNGMCAQRRLRSAWASAQSDQSLRCPYEESLDPRPTIERTAKLLIRLGGCPGWSESSLGAQSFSWFCHEAAQLCTLRFWVSRFISFAVYCDDWLQVQDETRSKIKMNTNLEMRMETFLKDFFFLSLLGENLLKQSVWWDNINGYCLVQM